MHGKPLIYLDSAATALKPQIVIDQMTDFYQNHYGTVHRAVYELAVYAGELYQQTRDKAKQFLNAKKSEEIIFTRGTTESINMVAYSFGKAFISPGDEIIISQMEHHSNIVPWQMVAEERQAILKIIPINERGELILEEYESLLSERTRIVAITHISNALGTVNPIKQIIERAHHYGAKVLVDGAQSAPHFVIDVQELDADFFVFSGHKLFGPTGIGILYGKEKLLDLMPPYQGGGDMIEEVNFHKTTYNALPLKFEAGTPMVAEVIGLGAAIDYLNKIGLDNIHEWETKLVEYTQTQLEAIPEVRIIGKPRNRGSLVSFVIDGIHSLDIGTLLDLKGVAMRTGHHCAQPAMRFFGVPSTARASLAFYNTTDEVDSFINHLKSVIAMLKN